MSTAQTRLRVMWLYPGLVGCGVVYGVMRVRGMSANHAGEAFGASILIFLGLATLPSYGLVAMALGPRLRTLDRLSLGAVAVLAAIATPLFVVTVWWTSSRLWLRHEALSNLIPGVGTVAAVGLAVAAGYFVVRAMRRGS